MEYKERESTSKDMGSLPNTVRYIGFDGEKVDGKNIQIEEFDSTVPATSDDDVLIHVTHSSINALGMYCIALLFWALTTLLCINHTIHNVF
jgi:hypothetical protein